MERRRSWIVFVALGCCAVPAWGLPLLTNGSFETGAQLPWINAGSPNNGVNNVSIEQGNIADPTDTSSDGTWKRWKNELNYTKSRLNTGTLTQTVSMTSGSYQLSYSVDVMRVCLNGSYVPFVDTQAYAMVNFLVDGVLVSGFTSTKVTDDGAWHKVTYSTPAAVTVSSSVAVQVQWVDTTSTSTSKSFNNVKIDAGDIHVVPEPAMLGLLLAGLPMLRRRHIIAAG